jgi:hypothetical protein
VRQFGGTEPLVGEVLGLRTFRVDESGLLLPLYSSGTWYDGPNTAQCAPPTGHHERGPHPVPSDDCECGFYAYGTPEAARQNKHMRHVQAVVSCWGAVVAGTQGIRAEHARIVAIWINPAAPAWLRKRVATRYPSARLYADPDAMLAEHPLTPLRCYDEPRPRPVAAAVLGILATAAVLALGLLPMPVLHTGFLWELWLAVTAATGALAAWLLVGAHTAGHVAAAFVVGGVLAWLVAPAFGLAGWLLRVPLLRGLAVAVGAYLLGLRPHHFPVVRAPRAPSFCGVRP